MPLAISKIWALALTVLIFVPAWAQQPRIDFVSPGQGPISGGTLVTITGTNLRNAAIAVNRNAVTPISQTDSEVRLQMPTGSGYGVVSARNASGVAYAEYLYVPPRLRDLPPGYITTVAGIGHFLGDGRVATRAMVEPVDIVVAPDRSIYIADQSFNQVRRIGPDGVITTVAGTGVHGLDAGGDGGLAVNAELRVPLGIALDTRGNLYIVDLSHRLRRVDAATGIITTIAGEAQRPGFSGDGGPASRALLDTPVAIVADRDGTLYIQEQGNGRIRRIAPDGIISTYAGTGVKGYSGDGGPATSAQLDAGLIDHGGLALDAEGNLYIAEYYHGAIRKVTKATGIITTVARSHDPGGITVAGNGDLYILSETDEIRSHRIMRTDAVGNAVETWGRGNGFAPDGTPARDAPFGHTRAITLDHEGNLLVAEPGIQRLRKLDRTTGLLGTVAGIGPNVLNEEGPAIGTSLGWDGGDLVALSDGSLLIGDSQRFRKIDSDANINTLSRTSEVEGVPGGVAGFDLLPDGSIVFGSCRGIRRFITSGVQPGYIAGRCGPVGFAGDGGPASMAVFSETNDVAADRDGNLFVADVWNNRIRRIDAVTGIITTVAGIGPEGGNDAFGNGSFCGDGGLVTAACLNSPLSVAVDKDGTLFIGDDFNKRIRKVDPAGRISTVVQSGGAAILLDAGGNIYASNRSNLSRYSLGGTQFVVAGGPRPAGFSGDGGPATAAQTDVSGGFPGMAIDAEGNLYFRDSRRIRAVRYGAVVAPFGTRAAAGGITTRSATVSHEMAPLEVILRDGEGNPATHIRVDFTSPSSGASAVFANGEYRVTILTDRNGAARVAPIANCRLGQYSIAATPLTTGNPEPLTVRFALTNEGSNPVPRITQASPTILSARREVTIAISGRDFSPCTIARWNGSERPTRFVDTTHLQITLAASDLMSTGSGRITLSTPTPGGGVSNDIVIPVVEGPPAQFSISNGASFATSQLTPGSLASAFVATGVSQNYSASSLPLPTALGGITLRVGGSLNFDTARNQWVYSSTGSIAAGLLFVGSNQINFQVPTGFAVGNSIPAQLTKPDGSALLSTLKLAATAPGSFSLSQDGRFQGAVLNDDNSLNGPPSFIGGARSARRGSFIQIFATGAGETDPPLMSGEPAPVGGNPLVLTRVQPTVTIGNQPARVLFSGMAPGFVGLWQINVEVPLASAAGSAVPLVITAGDISSNTVTIAVQ